MVRTAGLGSGKCKRVFCETGLDSDSEEERSVLVVDSQGNTTSSRHLHIELAEKRPKGLPPPTASALPVEPTTSDAGKPKKKQVSSNHFLYDMYLQT